MKAYKKYKYKSFVMLDNEAFPEDEANALGDRGYNLIVARPFVTQKKGYRGMTPTTEFIFMKEYITNVR